MTAGRSIRGLSYERIHNALIVLARDATFYGIAHDKDSGMVTVLEDDTNKVAPQTVRANEAQGSFDEAEKFRRYQADERRGWLWNLALVFDVEASVEHFEASMTESGLVRLQADPTLNRPQVTFRLKRSLYDHQTHDADRGTKVTFQIEASLAGL